jgi:elongation factor 1-beta
MSKVRIRGALIMGDVAIILKIMPESPDVDLEALKSEIKEAVAVHDIVEEPIGFGLSALKVAVVVPDQEGVADAVQDKITAINGVEHADIVGQTLL